MNGSSRTCSPAPPASTWPFSSSRLTTRSCRRRASIWKFFRLLGLRHGVVALTKCDLVDGTTRRGRRAGNPRTTARYFPGRRSDHSHIGSRWRRHCRTEERTGTIVPTAPLTPTPLPAGERGRGEGADSSFILHPSSFSSSFPFRMAIDRSFIVQGHGTVVTGSVTSGSVRVGDEAGMAATRRARCACVRCRITTSR